jgi:hypothetical protein
MKFFAISPSGVGKTRLCMHFLTTEVDKQRGAFVDMPRLFRVISYGIEISMSNPARYGQF